ncbi:MAG TPA: pyridoxamine 5'-phosphate oxidase [Herpetosiphonaceae bacterium]
MSIADLRREYTQHGLSESEVDADPFVQFRVWFDNALSAQVPEPNAMTLATATPDGKPSARVVLLKGFDQRGFVFYTNYQSRKGGEIEANRWAALVFFWPELERQIRIEGRVERVSPQESDDYFASRPAGSRLGAWASPQSQVISSRDVLEQRLSVFTDQYTDQAIPRPPHWGGYRVAPVSIEFWQGRPSRLHDRLRYRLSDDQRWTLERLAP